MTKEELINEYVKIMQAARLKGWTLEKVIRNTIKWAEIHQWISVDDALPDMYQDVIVFNNGKPISSRRGRLPWWEKDKWQWSRALTNVTHWMPIPNLPHEEAVIAGLKQLEKQCKKSKHNHDPRRV